MTEISPETIVSRGMLLKEEAVHFVDGLAALVMRFQGALQSCALGESGEIDVGGIGAMKNEREYVVACRLAGEGGKAAAEI